MKDFLKKRFKLLSVLLICLFLASATSAYPQTSQQITNGLAWLESNQSLDGSWAENTTTSYHSTSTVVESLNLIGSKDLVYTNAVNWIVAQQVDNVRYLSLKIISLAPSGNDISPDINSLLSYRNSDGGFGEYIGGTSGVSHTFLSLLALKAANYPDQTVIDNAINYLLLNQNSDGGFGAIKDKPSEIFYTAMAFLVLNDFKRSFNLTSSLSSASSYLLSRQNLDGSFGSSIFETALAYQALTRSTLDLAIRSAAITYLTSSQFPDGSWDEDPYSTALAIRALSDSGIISSAQINPINLTKVIDGISQPASTYSAYETMTIGVTTADPDALLEVTVQDSSGTIYSTRTEGGEIFFDTQNLAPGTYTIIVMATDPQTGIIIDEERFTFSIRDVKKGQNFVLQGQVIVHLFGRYELYKNMT